jgi:hypothetical protein
VLRFDSSFYGNPKLCNNNDKIHSHKALLCKYEDVTKLKDGWTEHKSINLSRSGSILWLQDFLDNIKRQSFVCRLVLHSFSSPFLFSASTFS